MSEQKSELEKAGQMRGKVKGLSKTREQRLRQATKAKQVIVKIASYASGAKRAGATIDYISRDGDLEMENQDGELLSQQQVKETMAEWEKDFGKEKTTRKGMESRDTMHMILSTPEGSDKTSTVNAASDFLNEQFGGQNDYLFTVHDDTKNPHVHIVVKTKGMDGKRLRTNKQTLMEWRQNFAEHAISYGIEVDASSRLSRGVGTRTPSLELKNTINTLGKKGIETVAQTQFVKGIRKDFEEYQKTKKIELKPWEIKAKQITQKEKQGFRDESEQILKESKGQGSDKKKLLAEADILKKYAESIPEPKSKREQTLEHLIEKTKEKEQEKSRGKNKEIDFD